MAPQFIVKAGPTETIPQDLERRGKFWFGFIFRGRTNQGGYHEQESFVDEAHVPIAQRK